MKSFLLVDLLWIKNSHNSPSLFMLKFVSLVVNDPCEPHRNGLDPKNPITSTQAPTTTSLTNLAMQSHN